MDTYIIFVVICGIYLLLIYFLPSFFAIKKKNAAAIFVLNLLLGWTLIGWIVALVWACIKDTPPVVFKDNTENSSTADELEKLAKLKEQGILTEEEFQEQKAKLLNN